MVLSVIEAPGSGGDAARVTFDIPTTVINPADGSGFFVDGNEAATCSQVSADVIDFAGFGGGGVFSGAGWVINSPAGISPDPGNQTGSVS